MYLGQLQLDGLVFEGTHPQLVDRATWEAAQVSIGTIGSSEAALPLLRGLVRCAECRYLLKARKTNGGRYSYNCRHLGRAGGCRGSGQIIAQSGPLRIVGLEKYVVERMWEWLDDYEGRIDADSSSADERRVALAAVSDLQARLNTHAADVSGLVGRWGQDAFEAMGDALAKELAEAEEHLRQLNRRSRQLLDTPVEELKKTWPDMSIAERHRVLARLIRAIFIRRGKPRPDLVTEARRLRAEGASFREIGCQLGTDGHTAKYWATDPRATGTQSKGASPERVHIVWADEPPVDLPRHGRLDWLPRPFDPGDLG
jgi:hypothetical protein